MLNVMLLSAGVTTGWHLAQVAQQAFGDEICLHLCDTNPRELVPAAALGGAFHRVLPLADRRMNNKFSICCGKIILMC